VRRRERKQKKEQTISRKPQTDKIDPIVSQNHALFMLNLARYRDIDRNFFLYRDIDVNLARYRDIDFLSWLKWKKQSQYEAGQIDVPWVPSVENWADIFTKPLGPGLFNPLRERITVAVTP
jgi:hypothetical protein